MIYKSFAHNGHRFKTAMWVGGETGHSAPMVHAPTIFNGKIIAEVATAEGSSRAHFGIALGVKVFVVDTEEEGVMGFPGKAEGADAEDIWHIEVILWNKVQIFEAKGLA